MSNDALGDRMKAYEAVTRHVLPRRTYTMIRLDGKSFHTWTKRNHCERPFDKRLMYRMAETTRQLVREISGCVLGYTQSDEISLLLTDFKTIQTEPWLGGSLQKIVSISASMATCFFNEGPEDGLARDALFDSRCFIVPDPTEVANQMIFRQKDCQRNSVSMAAQSQFSHKDLQGKSVRDMVTMMDENGQPWDALPNEFKDGVVAYRSTEVKPVTYTDKRTGEDVTLPAVERGVVRVEAAPVFTKTTFLRDIIPTYTSVSQNDILQRAR